MRIFAFGLMAGRSRKTRRRVLLLTEDWVLWRLCLLRDVAPVFSTLPTFIWSTPIRYCFPVGSCLSACCGLNGTKTFSMGRCRNGTRTLDQCGVGCFIAQ